LAKKAEKDLELDQQKEVVLDLEKVPPSNRVQVKNEIGELIVDEILRSVSSGKSPVEEERKRFDELNQDYADREKGGDTTPNLELTSDMLNSLDFKRTRSGVAVGITKSSQRDKAEGHNNFFGESKLPQRRFIPAFNQGFKTSIMNKVKDIIKQESTREVGGIRRQTPTAAREGEGISTELRDIFSERSINVILERLLRASSS